jgi:endonuclease/exonuclease/phosphatase family metal-dependent hydrolase
MKLPHSVSRCLLSALLLALWLSCPALAQRRPQLAIGTWNLEFLGAPGNLRNDTPPRTDADLAAIGQKIKQLGVAVLAVQEICGEAPLQHVTESIGRNWAFVLGTTGGWDDGKTAQNIGFVYDNTVVELLSAEELLTFPRQQEGVPIFHRVPVTACFKVRTTGFDFRAVTVHLKAGQKAPDEQKRRLEATILHDWIKKLQATPGEDQDIVVLGDFNSTYGTEPETVLEEGQMMHYLEPKTRTPTIMHFAEPIDQIVVAPAFDELNADSFTVHSDFGGLDKNAWRKIYSDHFPVTATISATSDGDPTATFTHGPAEQSLPASHRPAGGVAPANATAPASGAAPAAKTAAWPPIPGTTMRVTDLGGQIFEGNLVQTLPDGPGGWVVLDVRGSTTAIPMLQVRVVQFK